MNKLDMKKWNPSNYIKNEFLIVFIYYCLLFVIDYSGLIDLYDQSLVRRCINFYRRIDELNYMNKIKPFCESVKKILTKNDIIELQSIYIPKTKGVPWLTRKNITTHQCCESFSEEEIRIIKEMSEKIKKEYEEYIDKELYYLGDNKATFYVYRGKDSHHLWHVDPRNVSEIYNVIVCVKKTGEISPLQCKDKDGNVNSIYFEEGDAAFFNGGTTVHQVPPNEDENSERIVLAMSFTSNPNLNDDKNVGNNLCTYIEGGNNFFNLFKIILTFFVLNLVIGFASGISNLSYKFLFIYLVIILLLLQIIPLYIDIGLGTGRGSSLHHNIILALSFIVYTFSVKGGILFFTYFALSDLFFLPSWVAYD